MNKTLVVIVIIILVVLVGWYLWSMLSPSPSSIPTTQTSNTPSSILGIKGSDNQTNTGAPAGPILKISHDAKLNDYLVARSGMTLYRYTKDSNGISNCAGTCADNWPPYIVPSGQVLLPGTGINGKLDTIAREDGSMQLTYNGAPLYFWKNDKKVADTLGQGIGSVWFEVKP